MRRAALVPLIAALPPLRGLAALLAEPQVTIAKDVVRVYAKAYDAIATRFVISVWVSTAQRAAANPERARACGKYGALARAAD